MEIVNFINNMESVFDDLVMKHKCFKLDKKTKYMVETGASTQVYIEQWDSLNMRFR